MPTWRHAGPRLGCVVLLLALSTGLVPVVAQVSPPAILSLPGSVRSAGLHGAGAALVGDAGAVFANPVGIATLRHIGLEGTYRRTRFNATVGTAAMGWRLSQFDVGLGLAYVGGDSVPMVGLSRGLGGRPYEAMGVGSLVYRFGLIAFGGSIRELRRSAGGGEDHGRSGDLGIALAVFDIMAMGFSMQNVGGNWRPQSLLPMPRLTRWGFTMNYADPQETFRLLTTLEAQWPQGQPSRWILGGEAGVVVYGVGLLGRAAYQTRTAGTAEPAVTFGGSAALARLRLDYAYAARDLVGAPAHRLGLRLTL
ncbi:MAG: hypothetical protein HYV20_08880 [Gemmatimonadetes bacterium]|nr:hypothetical protein [Gemmatimonadota bacterium]